MSSTNGSPPSTSLPGTFLLWACYNPLSITPSPCNSMYSLIYINLKNWIHLNNLLNNLKTSRGKCFVLIQLKKFTSSQMEKEVLQITIYHTNKNTKKWIMKIRSRSHLYVVACQMRIDPSSNPTRIVGNSRWN